MNYKVKEHEINPQNYLVMDEEDFNTFVINYKLPTFNDDGMLFTYWNDLQIVQKYEEDDERRTRNKRKTFTLY